MLRKVVLFSLIALVAVLGLGASFAFAQADAPDTEEDAPVRPRDIIDPDVIKEAVASALGLTVDELEAAHEEGMTLSDIAAQQGVEMEEVRAAAEEARNEMIDDALEAGTIDEEQAERLRNAPFRGPRGRRGGPHGVLRGFLREIVDPDVVKEAVANTLGLTVEEVQAAREEGATLPELAEEQGVEMEDIRVATEEVMADMIQQAIDDETITEEQGQRLLDALETGPGLFFGGRGRCHGGFGSPPPGAPEDAPVDLNAQDA